MIILTAEISRAALDLLLEDVHRYCTLVHSFKSEDGVRGTFRSDAGWGMYSHCDQKLIVKIFQDHGHFPAAMIRGGFRQLVEEAKERAASSVKSAHDAQIAQARVPEPPL